MQTNSKRIIIVALIVGFLVILFTSLQAQQDSYEQEIARIQRTQQANRENSGPCLPDGSIYNPQTNQCVYAGNLAEPKEPVR